MEERPATPRKAHYFPTAEVFKVDTRGAVILHEGSQETRDGRGIYLSNSIEHVSHIAVDIGGSLAKVVYFTRSPKQLPSLFNGNGNGYSNGSSHSPDRSPKHLKPGSRTPPPLKDVSLHLLRSGAFTPSVLESNSTPLDEGGLASKPPGPAQ